MSDERRSLKLRAADNRQDPAPSAIRSPRMRPRRIVANIAKLPELLRWGG